MGGLTPTPNPFLVVDFYNQNRACLLPEKGLPAPGPYSTPLRTPLWNGSNHCRYQPPFSYCIGWGRAVGLPNLRGDASLGAWWGLVSPRHLPLFSLAEASVPLLHNWRNHRHYFCYVRAEKLWGFLPSGNICSFILTLLGGKREPLPHFL